MKSKARSNHFAGQIINLDDNGVEKSSLKHSEKYFWWPDPLNDSWVDINDIHLKLDPQNMDRRQHLIFGNDIEKINIVVFIIYFIKAQNKGQRIEDSLLQWSPSAL